VATAQAHAREWGADPGRVVLMGHSAGAHLVALLGSEPSMLAQAGARRPLGVVSLDSAAMDVPQLMAMPRHPALYDRAFGGDQAYWAAASPTLQIGRDALPMLAVCSSERQDSCPQAHALARKAQALGVRIEVQPELLSHMQINHDLGTPSEYTRRVVGYIDGLVATH
jgi:acetyl esterase/lipase